MIFFPGVFFTYLYKNKSNLKEETVFQITRFFQAGYREEKYFWEFITLLRKFSIILITTFLRNNNEAVVYILIPVVTIFFFLQIYEKPFEAQRYNRLELVSLNACFITYYMAIFYLRVISDAAKIFLLIMILGSNIIFFCHWLKLYLIVLKGRVQKIIKTMGSSKKKPLQ